MKRILALGLALIVASGLLMAGCKQGTSEEAVKEASDTAKAEMKKKMQEMGKTALPGDKSTMPSDPGVAPTE